MDGEENGVGNKVEEPYRSKGERQLARLFGRFGIDYRYEEPLVVRDRSRDRSQNKVRIWYPDFQLPEYGIIIEYAGMNGNREYDLGIEHKKEVYGEMGLSAIFVNRESFKGYWPGRVLSSIRNILEDRLDDFHKKIGRSIPVGVGREPVEEDS